MSAYVSVWSNGPGMGAACDPLQPSLWFSTHSCKAMLAALLLNPVRGCRWALVVLRGTDVPNWAGHYGCKFAGPQLTFGNTTCSAPEDCTV